MDSSRLVTLYKRGSLSGDPTKNYSPVDLSAQNSLFGSIAKNILPLATGQSFIPLDANGKTLDLRGDFVGAQWLGLQSKSMQFWSYIYCSPLAAVIDRLAESDTNGKIQFTNDDGTLNKTYKKNPVLNRVGKLLSKPNPLQTWEEFNAQQIVLCKIFGYCPVFALGPKGFDKSYTKSLWNLNPYFTTPQYNYQFDIYSDDEILLNPITNWLVSIFGSNMEIAASDIILIKDGYVDTLTTHLSLPLSKIAGLDYFISNICAAMEADNVLLKKKGPLGVFSYDAKSDLSGWNPMTTKEKDEVQGDLKQYGMTWAQLQYIVSRVPIKWNSMSFNVQELMTKETVRQGIDGICDRFGYPAELMSGKNATYENRNSAEKFLYQNNIIPFSLRRMAFYNTFFGIEGLSQNFNYLPVLQEDVQKAGEARYALSQSLQIDWLNDMITRNEYRSFHGQESVTDGELYYSEWIKKYPAPVKQVATTKTKVKPNAKAAS